MTARAAIEIHAGLIPGQPMSEFTRHYWITSGQWQQARDKDAAAVTDNERSVMLPVSECASLLLETQGQANAYAAYLMMQPDRVNWVKTEWIWF